MRTQATLVDDDTAGRMMVAGTLLERAFDQLATIQRNLGDEQRAALDDVLMLLARAREQLPARC
jgi:hypothetical protein